MLPKEEESGGDAMKTRLSRRALLAASLVAAAGPAARAQDGAYPKAPIKTIVPAAPGGPTDVMARDRKSVV